MRLRARAALAVTILAAGCSRTVTLLSYNTHNLFDGRDDGTEYRDYDPGGGRWSEADYRAKLERMATVIARAVPGGPDILVLQEIENRSALDELCSLCPGGYPYRTISAARGSAVQTAVASRLPIRRSAAIDVGQWQGASLRPLLEAEIDCGGCVLTVLAVHWKSPLEGVTETEPAREVAASAVAARVAGLLATDPQRRVVVAGDFNEDSDGPALAGLLGSGLGLHDPWSEVQPSQRGSAAYREAWHSPDHLLLSAGLMGRRGLSYRPRSFRAVRHSFMLEEASGLPLRDRRFAWRYSDHVPIAAEFEVRGVDLRERCARDP